MIQRITGSLDLVEAAPLGFNHAADKEHMGQLWIEGFGRMLGKQAFHCAQVLRHQPIIPDIHMIFINTDLDGIAGGIVLVDNGVEQNLTESVPGKHEDFHPLDAVIGDPGFHIFGINQVNHAVNLLDQWAMDFILILQIGIGIAKEADLDVCTGDPTLRVTIESQHGSTGQIAVLIHQMQVFHQDLIADGGVIGCETASGERFLLE